MSFLKLTGAVRVLLAASAVFAASSQVARAETIFLKCGDFNTFTVDLLKSTVDNYPARITPLSIEWQNTGGDFVVNNYIDRATGIMTMSHHGHQFKHTCETVSQPPTKF